MVPEALAVVSVEEFWHLAHRFERAELVGGQIVEMTPPGFRHGAIVVTIARLLHEHVAVEGLGAVVAETGFVLSRDPPTVRAPDVAVVLAARVPSPSPVRFFQGPPDLAVEVLSPDESPAELAAKVTDYLRAGTQAVWVVDPNSHRVTVHTRNGATRYAPDEMLDGAPVLPALRLPVAKLLA
ncbi:MAG: Uma2 family endonuclease, partial [bacterium]